jgi:alpha-beta hydrolase superfamily lysophospholipase
LTTDDRFTRFPAALASQSRQMRAGDVPVLLSHPDWTSPAPVVLWMHGRTVSKELDPGRYLRWLRAGIATCAIDLPGHGERFVDDFHRPERTLDVLTQVLHEIDEVVEHLADPVFQGVFDLERMALGGMSAGGMAALRRLCDPHPFRCAAVEATTGNLQALYEDRADRPWPVRHPPDRVALLDPMQHLALWRPIPLLVLHSEADRIVPFAGMRTFVDELRQRYRALGSDPAQIQLHTWPETGAPGEHSGFGRHSNEAKNVQTEFLRRHLLS